MPDLDILSQLPPLIWRGVEVPAQANAIRFEHGLVEHRQHGVDGGHQENTGRGSMVVQFRIPFRAGLIEYPDLYPTRFRDFWNACLDGTVGNLSHPEFGEFDAKCASFSLSATPERRDGYDVDVEFRETTENEVTAADNPMGPIADAISVMQDFESLASNIDPVPEYDDGSFGSPLQALKQIQGSLLMLDMTISGKIGQINNAINAFNDMIDTVNSATSPAAWEAADALKQVVADLHETKDTLGANQKKIDFRIAQKEIDIHTLASSVGMSMDDFIKLNPKLAKTGKVEAGQEYFVQV